MSTRCPVCVTGELTPFEVVRGTAYWRCRQCQATLMDPESRLSGEREKTVYGLHENDPEDPGYRRFLARLTTPLLQRLLPGACGLDFGCGPGPTLAVMLEEQGMEMALYDPFFHPDETVLQGSYDFITCTEVVEHLHHPAEVFRQLDRMLKPGSCLGVMTCFQTDDARFANWHYRRDPTHVVFYREATMAWLARAFGWEMDVPAKDVVLFQKPG